MQEEDFFELHFSYEAEPAENLKTSLSLLYSKYKEAEEFASDVTSGVCMDEAESQIILQGVIMAYKFVCRFLAESGMSVKGGIIEALKASSSAEQYCSCIA